MPAKGASTRLNPVRLQTIQHLRVRRPNQQQQNACATIMSAMLSTSFFLLGYFAHQLIVYFIFSLPDLLIFFLITDCWASAGHGNEGCSGLEESLKACMDQRVRIHPFILFPSDLFKILIANLSAPYRKTKLPNPTPSTTTL